MKLWFLKKSKKMQKQREKQLIGLAVAVVMMLPVITGCSNSQSETLPKDSPTQPTSAASATSAPTSTKAVEDIFTAGGKLAQYMDKLVTDDRFSGVVLVAKDGNPQFKKAYGKANKEKNIPNSVETKFNIGSMSKMLTAVAIAQLVEAGKLSFDDTIDKYISGFPAEIGSKVTIAQLLTHTSGMGDFMNPDYFSKANSIRSVQEFMGYVINQPLNFEPGAQHVYSNSGFVTLGAIIEKASGQNYYDYIKKHITEPLEMNNTDFFEKNTNTPNLAHGYLPADRAHGPNTLTPKEPPTRGKLPDKLPQKEDKRSTEPLIDNMDTLPLKGNPSGGGYSTVDDMLKFANALLANKLLSKEYTDNVLLGKVDTPVGRYAYGFEDLNEGGHRTVGHSGGSPGANAFFRIFMDNGYTVVVLSNYDEGARAPFEEIVQLMSK